MNTLLRLRLLQITFRVPAPHSTSLIHLNQTAGMTGSGHSLSSAACTSSGSLTGRRLQRADWVRCSRADRWCFGGAIFSQGIFVFRVLYPRLDQLGSRNIISASLGPVEAEPLSSHALSASASASCFLGLSLIVAGCAVSWEAVELSQSPHVPRHPQTSESRGGLAQDQTTTGRLRLVSTVEPTPVRRALTRLPLRPGHHVASGTCTCSPSRVGPKALTTR